MRCQENTGFLILHRCEKIAEYECALCGRKVCTEHGGPLSETAQPAGAPAPAGSRYACRTCLQRQQGTAGEQARDDYEYPYRGSYRPFRSAYYFDDTDRRAFARDAAALPPDQVDGLGS